MKQFEKRKNKTACFHSFFHSNLHLFKLIKLIKLKFSNLFIWFSFSNQSNDCFFFRFCSPFFFIFLYSHITFFSRVSSFYFIILFFWWWFDHQRFYVFIPNVFSRIVFQYFFSIVRYEKFRQIIRSKSLFEIFNMLTLIDEINFEFVNLFECDDEKS